MGSRFRGNNKLEVLQFQIECYKITLARRQYQRGFQIMHRQAESLARLAGRCLTVCRCQYAIDKLLRGAEVVGGIH